MTATEALELVGDDSGGQSQSAEKVTAGRHDRDVVDVDDDESVSSQISSATRTFKCPQPTHAVTAVAAAAAAAATASFTAFIHGCHWTFL